MDGDPYEISRYQNGKYICENCLDDDALRSLVRGNRENKDCDFCGVQSAAYVGDVVDHIAKVIRFYWIEAVDVLPWDDGWFPANSVYSFEEVLIELGIYDISSSIDVIEDVRGGLISDQEWCKKYLFQLSYEQSLRFGWESFARLVKHHNRYTFFRTDDEPENPAKDDIPPARMLDTLASVLKLLEDDILKTLDAGTIVTRVRVHEKTKVLSTVSELSAPPVEYTNYSNRMSPAGIPMFYGAFDKNTAIRETYDSQHNNSQIATVGTFKILRPMHVLDLTRLPSPPSIFDLDQARRIQALNFMKRFVREISKPVEKDGREHIDYVPTQVFSEYLKQIYLTKENKKLKGMVYPSAKNDGSASCVLFLENEHACEKNVTPNKDHWLKLIAIERIEDLTEFG